MAPSSTTFESLYEAANAADTSPAPPSTPTPTKSSKSQTSPARSSAKRAGPDTSPVTPTKKGRNAAAITPSLTSTSASSPTDWSTVEGWTPEKREAFMNRVIGQGVVAIGTAALAEEFGVTKISINNAISAGKKGNLREKAIKAVRG